MKLYLAVAVCTALICIVGSSHVSLQDFKIITDTKVFEQIKKQETENGKVISCETIQITKPNKDNNNEETTCKDVLSTRQDTEQVQQERRRRLFASFLKHFRMAKLLHSLLNNFPAESAALEQPKHHPVHHHHRVYIIRIPLTSMALPFSTVTLPSQNKTELNISPSINQSNDLSDRPEVLTTPSIQDQIPSPEMTGNQITDNEIPTD